MGVTFTSDTKEGILDELTAGKTSPTGDIQFRFANLGPEAKTGLLRYCDYDHAVGVLKYDVDP
jgi:hypothetical protein